jgi:hypothetical protein
MSVNSVLKRTELFFYGAKMKKSIIFGAVVIALGLLAALGPQFLFKVCAAHSGAFPLCHWTARAELGMGILFASLLVIGLPHALIGGCKGDAMACRRVAFPAITVIGIVLLVCSIVVVIHSEMKNRLPKRNNKCASVSLKTGD